MVDTCGLGLFAAYAKQNGVIVDEVALNEKLKDVHAKARYAAGGQKYDAKLAAEAILQLDPKSNKAKVYSFFQRIGVPVKDMYTYTMNPEEVLGVKTVKAVEALFQKHLASNEGKFNKRDWAKNYRPKILELRPDKLSEKLGNVKVLKGMLKEHLDSNAGKKAGAFDGGQWASNYGKQATKLKESLKGDINPLYLDYADKYFKKMAAGGQFSHSGKMNPVATLGRNAVSNLVTQNPLITTMNVFEFMPKALAYSIENGNPAAVFSALSTYLAKTNGQFWKRIPELAAKGVYGEAKAHTGIKGLNLLDVTENPLRGLSYYLGEAIAPGKGSEALEKVAFVNRFGNEPMVFLDASGADTLALMRYSLSATKMYMGLIGRVIKRDANAALALGAFTAMTALQTGTSSAIPQPVDFLMDKAMPEEYHKFLAELDAATPLNIAQKTLGTDFAKQVRPIGGFAFSAGGQLATSDLKAAGAGLGRAAEGLGEENYAKSATGILQFLFASGQLAKIPGVNITSKRIVDELAKVVAEDVGNTPDEWGPDLMTKLGLNNQPESF